VAWYQSNYFNLFIGNLVHFFKKIDFNRLLFIIILSTCLICYNELHKPVKCFFLVKDTNFLNRHIYNGRLVYSYKNINNCVVNEVFDKILNLKLNNTNFNILEFRKLNGGRFNRCHPLAHYHLNFLDFNNINSDILINMQFSTQNINN